jgi:hypothetical protein
MINPLEHARPDSGVHFEGTTQDYSGDLVDLQSSIFFLVYLCGREQAVFGRSGWV